MKANLTDYIEKQSQSETGQGQRKQELEKEYRNLVDEVFTKDDDGTPLKIATSEEHDGDFFQQLQQKVEEEQERKQERENTINDLRKRIDKLKKTMQLYSFLPSKQNRVAPLFAEPHEAEFEKWLRRITDRD